MSWQATEWVRTTRVGDSKLKLLLLMLCNYANEKGESWYPQEQIAFDTEIPVRTLRRKLEELQGLGFIEVILRTGDSGLRENSLIRVLMGPAANLADGHNHRPKTGVTTGQKELLPPANKVAAVNLNHSNHNNHTARAKKKIGVNDRIEYSEEFETSVWQPYPRRDGSKKKAYDFWNMLNNENRARVIAAIPLFAEQMKREGRPNDKIPHLTTWFNERRYETVAAVAAPAGSAGPAKRFWEYATEKQWANVLLAWSANWNWSESWGPEPGKPGCHVPPDLLDRFDLKYRGHLFSPEEKEAKKARISRPRDGEAPSPPAA
jgi:hypothetical protein